MEKAEIMIMLNKLINHREKLMNGYGATRTPEKMFAVSRIRKTLSMIQHWSLRGICREILNMREDIDRLRPGPSSKFYHTTNDKINKLLAFCEKENSKWETPKLTLFDN